ncbi:hypothetical protein CcCBS67573_g08911 [Chytriomyces confervae]|uniref:C2H2-type domain-containing protein n=1 Tax=Chytriomyces confervae TaxID=246404 RepID=A0A507ECS7_9FUNG|nr:hypothetical protein CcCBS67573_g08911 [Chytriomyces confervae]
MTQPNLAALDVLAAVALQEAFLYRRISSTPSLTTEHSTTIHLPSHIQCPSPPPSPTDMNEPTTTTTQPQEATRIPITTTLKYDKKLHYQRQLSRTMSLSTATTQKGCTTGPHACSECGKLFRQRHALKSHLVSHSSVSPFVCRLEGGLCEARFRRKSDLCRHERSVKHSGGGA